MWITVAAIILAAAPLIYAGLRWVASKTTTKIDDAIFAKLEDNKLIELLAEKIEEYGRKRLAQAETDKIEK